MRRLYVGSQLDDQEPAERTRPYPLGITRSCDLERRIEQPPPKPWPRWIGLTLSLLGVAFGLLLLGLVLASGGRWP